MKVKTLIILILVFAVLLAGAYGLYNYLSADMEMESLVTQGDTVAAAPQTEPDPDPPAEETPVSAEEPDNTAQEELSAAPDFTVYDGEGNEVHLSDFRGKPVILNFWASWCGPCQSEMPDFDQAYKTYGEDIHFVMVNLTDGSRETIETASAFIQESGYSFPVYYDTSYSAAIAYGTSSIPVTYFIDAEGNAVAYGMGAMDAEVLQMGLDMIYTP